MFLVVGDLVVRFVSSAGVVHFGCALFSCPRCIKSDMTLTQEITDEITALLVQDSHLTSQDHRIALLVVGQLSLAQAFDAVSVAVDLAGVFGLADVVFVSSQPFDATHTALLPEDLRLCRIESDEIHAAQGCLCCSMRSELTSTLSRLFLQVLRREQPRVRLVVLVTCAQDASPLRNALRHAPFLGQRYRWLGAIGTAS